MAKLSLSFAGMDEYIERLQKIGESVEAATEEALQRSVNIINEELHTEMAKHHVTGETESSLRDNEKVRWKGSKASIKYGFDTKKGGLPAIFLEKGRPHQRPTPVMKPALKRAEKRIAKAQEEAFKEAMERSR